MRPREERSREVALPPGCLVGGAGPVTNEASRHTIVHRPPIVAGSVALDAEVRPVRPSRNDRPSIIATNGKTQTTVGSEGRGERRFLLGAAGLRGGAVP